MYLLTGPSIFWSCLEKLTALRFIWEWIFTKTDKLFWKRNPRRNHSWPVIKNLTSKDQGRPPLLGKELDQIIQEYITNLRTIKGVVNFFIVIDTARSDML